MAAAALVIYVSWLTIAFAVQPVLMRRRTGDSGWRGFSRSPRHAGWLIGFLLVTGLAITLGAPVASLAGLGSMIGVPLVGWLGLLVSVCGGLFAIASQSAMGDAWRVGVDRSEQTAMVTTGLFARVRNPFFTGMIAIAIGIGLIVPNAVAVVGLVTLVVAVELQVRAVEEPYLLSVHGTTYQAYAARVGRFVPGLGLMSGGTAVPA